MRLATIRLNGTEKAAIITSSAVFPIHVVNEVFGQSWSTDLFDLIVKGQLKELQDWYRQKGQQELDVMPEKGLPLTEVQYGPLYRHPRKIWGIGLNYVEHASDLHEVAPSTEPASFMKPDTTIIGPGDTIFIPRQSKRTTAESELGIIIGEPCKDVPEEEAHRYIAGYTTIIDMTAEDILQVNPRYLTRAKSFDTFFSFGPHLVTTDEVPEVLDLEVATVINRQIHRKNVVSNMTFRPYFLVSFHSKVMQLLPGDIISSGTPGAVVIRDGDVVECRIDGFEPLVNPVKDLKRGDGC
jgi:2-keto-4-pentenoate hydratase/2-oxohepta-3-ene-1,7-dioic acid hydratase in catechol pathway